MECFNSENFGERFFSFNPENTKEIEFTKIGAKRPRNTMDSILEKFNK